MRGKASLGHYITSHMRITPAHAGKSSSSVLIIYSSPDHPRPCGEKILLSCTTSPLRGSPPPMRGKVWHSRRGRVPGGITPAHAGKRQRALSPLRKTQDHPRPCGEKELWERAMVQAIGSPPPMRGKDRAHERVDGLVGITPAHAGKRANLSKPMILTRDHPRPCGEKC